MSCVRDEGGIDASALFVFTAYLFICLSSVVAMFYLHHDVGFIYPELNALNTVSLIYFLFICLFGLISKRHYFLILPFVILTVPNAINDLLPNYLMGPSWERNSSAFSFFTHIDMFFIFGILRFYKNVSVDCRLFIFVVAGLLLFLVQVALKFDTQYLGPYFFGLYQIRYFMLLVLVVSLFDMKKDFKYLFWGICLAAMVLILESFATTYIRGAGAEQRLASGNFSVNVFGNILAALALFVYFGRQHVPLRVDTKLFLFICLLSLVIAMLLTGTKGSLFSLLVAFALLWRYVGFRRKSSYLFFYGSILVFVLLGIYFINAYAGYLTSLSLFDDGYVYDSDTSSLRTRVVLWGITLDMIKDHYVFGIGGGMWNYLKYDYGSPFDVLLDPHNDYLNFVVNYGVMGIVVVFFFYLYPLYNILFLKMRHDSYNFVNRDYVVFSSFIIPLAISSLTNANAAKHQVFALFFLFLLCSYKFYHKPKLKKKLI